MKKTYTWGLLPRTKVGKTKISSVAVGKLARHSQKAFDFKKGIIKVYAVWSRKFSSLPIWFSGLQAGGPQVPKCST